MEVPIPVKLSIDEINFAPYNPRSISKEDFANLVTSIDRFGFAENIVVNDRAHTDFPDGERDKLTLVSGHMRTRAARELGYDTLPAIILSLSPDEEKALNVAMNRISGEWDDQLLAELLYSLDNEMQGLTGFHDDELSKLLDSVSGEDEEEDEAPAVDDKNPPVSVVGEVYQLGPHRLMCGDSTKLEDVERLMAGKKADMVFTDPPYNTGMDEKSNDGSTRLNHMFNDSFTDEEWQSFMTAFTANYAKLMKDDSVAYICLDWRRNYELTPHIKKHFKLSNIIVWDKVVHGLGSDYQYTYELINVCKKGNPKIDSHVGDEAEYQDVWHIQRKVGRDDDHATKKPLELCERAMRHGSLRGQIIADLFGGSGSTLIAAENTSRVCYMMELDPKYCDVIRKRYAKHVGEEDWIACTPVIEKSEVLSGSHQGS